MRILSLALLFFSVFSAANALAEVDRSKFPAHLRALEWREVGPFKGGRATAVAGLSSDAKTYYMGSCGGGVWKTTDAGAHWKNVSDGYFGGSVGAVAVSEWDPNVVYVGLGEKTVRGNVSPGTGLWKSTDAGDTWTKLGLEDTQHVSRIRIHPKNPDLVYVAAMGHLFGPNETRGVFRSRNGGKTWKRIKFVNKDAGAVDLLMDPTNPRILYASFWRIRRTPYSLESGGEGSSLWKSVDGGDTWDELSDNEGFPKPPLGIIGVSVSPTNPKNVYAIAEAEEGGVLRSRDGGKTWTRVSKDRNLRQRAWYYTRLVADPADQEGLYVLNVRFHHSKDGGKTYREIPTPHGDNHDLWVAPNDPLRMIESNDGGANVSLDGGKTWSTQSNQPTAQMYRVSTDTAFPYRLLGGQQDFPALRIRSRSARGSVIGPRDWERTAGGESGHIAAKPDDPDIVVGGSYGGYLTILNHRSGRNRAINVWPDNPMGWGAAELKHRFQWNFPVLFSKHDPNILLVAAERVFKSDDLGESWTAISPDLTRNDKARMGPSGGPITKDNTSVEYYGTVFALAESQHEKGVLWAGSDDGRLHLTRDGGKSWKDVTPSRLPEWAQVNSLEIDPHEKGGLYVAATRYKSDDFEPYLFYTRDYGRGWKRIDRGIPRTHFTRVIRADPVRRGLLFAGTEFGLYHSLDGGRNWRPFQLDLPLVPITDLAIVDDDLIAATQGRGFWILDELSVLRQLEDAKPRTKLYAPGLVHRLAVGGHRRKTAGANGTNPHPGVVIHYALAKDLEAGTKLELAVLARGDDTPIWTWQREPADKEKKKKKNAPPETRVLKAKAGLNRHVWDLRYPSMRRFEDLILWGDLDGPLAVPGTYRVRMTVGKEVQEADFVVRTDPRTPSKAPDYAAQFAFVKASVDLLSRTHDEIGRIRAVRKQLEGVRERLKKSRKSEAEESPLETEITELLKAMTEVEEALYQTKNRSAQDPLNFPIRLNNKLISVASSVEGSDAAPTTQALAVKAELTTAIEARLKTLETIWNTRLPAVLERVQASGLSLVELPELRGR